MGFLFSCTSQEEPVPFIMVDTAKMYLNPEPDTLFTKEKGDILLSRYGTVGDVRHVRTKTIFQASYSIAILKPVAKNISDYLSLVLQTEPIQRQIKKHTRATAQPNLGLAHIRLLFVPLAPIEEQKKMIE